MPQMAIIQPATPKSPPQTRTTDAPGSKEQNKFSSHLDKAVSTNKKQQQTDQDESRTISSSKTEKSPSPKDNIKSHDAQEPEQGMEVAAAPDTASQPDKPEEDPEQLLIPVPATEKSMPIVVDTAFAPPQQLEPTVHQLEPTVQQLKPTVQKLEPTIPLPQNASITNSDQPDSFVEAGPAKAILAEISPAIVAPSGEKPIAAKEQNTLIDQLQSIIDQVDETGTVSISKVADPAPANSIRSNIHGVLLPAPVENSAQVIVPETAGVLDANVDGLTVSAADGAGKATGRPAQQLAGIRNDSQSQYFNPKTTTKDLSDTKQNFQEHQRGDELPQQTMGAGSQNGPSTGLASSPEQTNTFSQIVTAVPETPAPSTSETAKPIILPSGTIVQEDEVIQQLNNKLQISSRHMDSRINIKLHPAELGSLKIDLTVKEGSIRANVVAQSQHTSEILEKNMAKLKSVLESHGFTVDEISITAESESVSDFDLFDRQLFSHNDYTPQAQKGRREDEPVFTLPDNVFAAPTMRAGVNVKI